LRQCPRQERPASQVGEIDRQRGGKQAAFRSRGSVIEVPDHALPFHFAEMFRCLAIETPNAPACQQSEAKPAIPT